MTRRDLLVTLIPIILLVLVCILHTWQPEIYAALLNWCGVRPFRVPFVDSDFLFTAIDCRRIGVNPYINNTCDAVGRNYNYSPLLLRLFAWFGANGRWTKPFGIMLDLAFFTSLRFLPWPRISIAVLLAVLSPSVIFALERANIDLLIFCLIVAASFLIGRRSFPRWLGYGVLLLSGLLKFYPLTALIVLLREDFRRVLFASITIGLVLLGFVALWGDEIEQAVANLPDFIMFTNVGARTLPVLISVALAGGDTSGTGRGNDLYATWIMAGLTLVIVIGIWQLANNAVFRERFENLGESNRVPLLLGAALMTGCFFTCPSTFYRAIFLLLTLPGFLAMKFHRTAGIIIFVLWAEAIRHALIRLLGGTDDTLSSGQPIELLFLIIRELAWWWLIAILCACLARFVLLFFSTSLGWRPSERQIKLNSAA